MPSGINHLVLIKSLYLKSISCKKLQKNKSQVTATEQL